MSDYGGLVFVVDEPKRAEKLAARLSMGREFSDTLSAPDFKPGDFETGVLSFDRKHLSFFPARCAVADLSQRLNTRFTSRRS